MVTVDYLLRSLTTVGNKLFDLNVLDCNLRHLSLNV